LTSHQDTAALFVLADDEAICAIMSIVLIYLYNNRTQSNYSLTPQTH
jgi:hypothetical protein